MWLRRNFSASSIHSSLTSTNAALYSCKYLERWFSWVMYACLVAQSYLTLCHPMDYSPPGSFVHGILQGRILEWIAMPSFRGPFKPRDQTCVSYISCTGRQVIYHWCLGSPIIDIQHCINLFIYFYFNAIFYLIQYIQHIILSITALYKFKLNFIFSISA